MSEQGPTAHGKGPPERIEFRRQPDGYVLQRTIREFRFIDFTSHALERMKERGVSEAEVLDVLTKHQNISITTPPPTKRVRRRLKPGRVVDVVYRPEGDRIVVVTVIVNVKQ